MDRKDFMDSTFFHRSAINGALRKSVNRAETRCSTVAGTHAVAVAASAGVLIPIEGATFGVERLRPKCGKCWPYGNRTPTSRGCRGEVTLVTVRACAHLIFAYSFRASIKIGKSASASFQSVKNDSYNLRASLVWPLTAAARARPKRASGYSVETRKSV